ncbi:MAG: hypothetical protein V4438_01955 [Patescibacteria group bacterium]
MILTGESAIKIGRVRPIRLILALFAIVLSKHHREKLLAKYGGTYREALPNFLFAGHFCNVAEFDYYQTSHDPRVVPTTHRLFGGWVIIQERGAPVTAFELERENPFDAITLNTAFAEIDRVKQFCRLKNGKIALCDYGCQATLGALRKISFARNE